MRIPFRRTMRPEMWPGAVTVSVRRLAADVSHSAVLLIAGLPPEVAPGWLSAVSDAPGLVSTSMHIVPVEAAAAAASLRRKRARLEASRRYAFKHAQLDDPDVEAAAADAADLAARVAAGDTRLFTLAVYAMVSASTEAELDETIAHLRGRAAAIGLMVRPASFRQLQGLLSVLPFAVDRVRTERTVDTDTVAAMFPFTTADAPAADGVLLGHNLTSGAPVIWDRFAQPNHNQTVVARSGAGKSFFTKTEIARWVMRGVGVTVIDPEGEYRSLAGALDGTIIGVGEQDACLNPLDLPAVAGADALTRRVMFAHTVVATALGEDLDGDEAAALDAAVLGAYADAGIGPDRATWGRPAPLMGDVHALLGASGERAGRQLAARLAPFVTGGFSRLFSGATTRAPEGHLVVFDVSALPDELSAVATVLVLDAAWRRATADARRHLVFVDEAWRLLTTRSGAAFLARLAKSARKHVAGLTVVTQDAEDMLSGELGRVVIANAATHVLLQQAPQTLGLVAGAFALTGAERSFLATARRGEALLLGGATHVAFAPSAAEMDAGVLATGESR
ncbi:hypothetical protein Afil01_31400 [Actinorhabdospora filicis]|uniref:Conjugal transfer protein TraC n=1 Tax=Actinorhabdospora filicis TaxID=1785913 RepID=A0A9W6SLA6_9ACTN|nr:DUF87 domain-containing protein [Actinorhabdospora filicis]GLZ78333.1 hypothetical protein Afil01_31400 [Actinorhabdospora filicis]